VLHGYLRLLAPPLSIPPENIVIMGDSAGGGLSLALCLYLRDEGYKLPAGLVLMSPWVDLTMSCGSWDENGPYDVTPRPEAGGEFASFRKKLVLISDHLNPVSCYLGPKGLTEYITHPYASPLFADLSDLPPMLIQCGDSEVLRDEVTLLAHKATLSGVEVTHELYEDMIHVFQMFAFLPAAQAAVASAGRWVRVTLPGIEEEREASGLGWWGHPVPEGPLPEDGGVDPADPHAHVGRLGETTEHGLESEMRDGTVIPAGDDVFDNSPPQPDTDGVTPVAWLEEGIAHRYWRAERGARYRSRLVACVRVGF
jgi:hypothetical protein